MPVRLPPPARTVAAGLLLLFTLAACASSGPPGPAPASLAAARTAQERLDRPEAGRFAAAEITRLDRQIAMAEVAWQRGEAKLAQAHAEEALATLRLIEALGQADRARADRDAVEQTIIRLREEVGLGRPETRPETRPDPPPDARPAGPDAGPAPEEPQ